MLVIKYQKTGSARFISHIDILRHFARTLRRAQVPVEFSKGFNPHMLLYFSPPLALGMSSVAEYAAIAASMEKSEFLARYNAAAPAGLWADKVFEVAKDPKLQGIICCADYILPISPEGIKIGDKYEITYTSKNKLVVEEVGEKILGVWDEGGNTAVRLSSGAQNLRADRLAAQMARDFGKEIALPDIVKTAQYVKREDGLVDADDFLSDLERDAQMTDAIKEMQSEI